MQNMFVRKNKSFNCPHFSLSGALEIGWYKYWLCIKFNEENFCEYYRANKPAFSVFFKGDHEGKCPSGVGGEPEPTGTD